MAALIYCLCTATALICSVLLLRGYFRSRARLLFWSGLCFAALTLDNLFLVLDRVVWPAVNFAPWRPSFAFIGVALLLYGMIWEEKN